MASVCFPHIDVRHETEAELYAPQRDRGTAFLFVAQGDMLLEGDTLRGSNCWKY